MRARRRTEGFTLLELLVVSVLIAIALALSVPRVQGLFFNDPLSRSARLLVSAVNEARGMALESGRGSLLLVDFSSGGVWIKPQTVNSDQQAASAAEPPSLQLQEPVTFASAWTRSNGRQSSGTMPVWVNGRGMIEPAIIELRDPGRVISLKLSPFLAEAEVFDRALPMPGTLAAGTSINR